MKANILVVDDELAARQTLAEILRLEGYQVTMAENGKAAIELMEGDDYDLMLLDIKMPGMGGVDVLKKAVKISPECKVIILTAHGALDSAIEAVKQGAHDYLLKPASTNEILASVSRGVVERTDSDRRRWLIEQLESSLQQLKDVEGIEQSQQPISSVVALSSGVKVDLDRREIWFEDVRVNLTPTEGKLMKVLIENRGRVLSHQELVLLVQGYKTSDWEAPEILRPLVSRLRRKLSAFPGGRDWILNVRGTGYVFDGSTSV
jgi:DNA-binding response OmpR family regulator